MIILIRISIKANISSFIRFYRALDSNDSNYLVGTVMLRSHQRLMTINQYIAFVPVLYNTCRFAWKAKSKE